MEPRIATNLTEEEKEHVIDFLQQNPMLYSKRLAGFKGTVARDRLWAEQAMQMNRTSNELKIWYESMRTKLGKLKKAITKVSKGAKIRNRYNQVPHLTQDTNGKVTNSHLDTTNESQEVSSFPAGDHKAHINRCAQRHSKYKTEQKHKRFTKEVPPWNGR